uniref:Nucleotide exchange factor SIL1 n=1 Tax=Pseudonaja textilis TaxID=8673 RepID=A0A670Y876_PSETE
MPRGGLLMLVGKSVPYSRAAGVTGLALRSSRSSSSMAGRCTQVEEQLLQDDQRASPVTPTNLKSLNFLFSGQAIPPGLHVQLNLQTGEKLAKLPDDYKEKSDTKDSLKSKRYTDLKDFFFLFKLEEGQLLFALKMQSIREDLNRDNEFVDVRRRFRPIEKLKEEFRELNLQLETDLEIMLKLIHKFNNSASTLEEKITALSDLEYYVHQVDNAKDLLSLGGLQLLINGLNSSEPLMKEYASFVLGAALSSNPRVQVAAIQGGALQKLLVILATDQSLAVKKKALFALSSMLRHFPYAQQQFLKLGGLQVLRNLCTEKGMEILYIRTVTLLYDLVVEKLRAEMSRDEAGGKTQQYSQVNLMPAIVEQGWCTIISNLLRAPEHDSREKVLKTVHVLLAFCKDAYAGDPVLNHTLSLLRQEYEELAEEERKEGEEDGYFKELLHSINSIAQQLK